MGDQNDPCCNCTMHLLEILQKDLTVQSFSNTDVKALQYWGVRETSQVRQWGGWQCLIQKSSTAGSIRIHFVSRFARSTAVDGRQGMAPFPIFILRILVTSHFEPPGRGNQEQMGVTFIP